MSESINLSSMCASNAVAVTPADATPVNFVGLYVGVGGDVAIKGQNGVAVTFKNVPAGTFMPVVVTAVMNTNTTATNILGLTP